MSDLIAIGLMFAGLGVYAWILPKLCRAAYRWGFRAEDRRITRQDVARSVEQSRLIREMRSDASYDPYGNRLS